MLGPARLHHTIAAYRGGEPVSFTAADPLAAADHVYAVVAA